jgi:hypothetical protein
MAESKRTMARYVRTAGNADYKLGESDINNIDIVKIGDETSVNNKISENSVFKVLSNYPNPVRDKTTFIYQLFEPANVLLDLFTIEGKFLNRLIDDHKLPGYYRKTYNFFDTPGIKISKGIYIAKFVINNMSYSQKVQII